MLYDMRAGVFLWHNAGRLTSFNSCVQLRFVKIRKMLRKKIKNNNFAIFSCCKFVVFRAMFSISGEFECLESLALSLCVH